MRIDLLSSLLTYTTRRRANRKHVMPRSGANTFPRMYKICQTRKRKVPREITEKINKSEEERTARTEPVLDLVRPWYLSKRNYRRRKDSSRIPLRYRPLILIRQNAQFNFLPYLLKSHACNITRVKISVSLAKSQSRWIWNGACKFFPNKSDRFSPPLSRRDSESRVKLIFAGKKRKKKKKKEDRAK